MRRNRVQTSRVPGPTAQQPAECQPTSPQCAVHGHRLDRVRAATGVEPTGRWEQRGDPPAVDADQRDQQSCHWSGSVPEFEFGNAHTIASLPAEPAKRGIQVDTEFRAGSSGSRRQRSDHQRAAGGQSSEAVPHEVSQPAADAVADHRVADRLTHDKAHPGRPRWHGPIPGGRARIYYCCLAGGRHQGVHHQPGPTSTTSPANHRPELLATGEPGGRGEHGFAEWIRRTARRGPCACGQREWPDQRACACADGIRASSRDDGCWAGRCACPCSLSVSRLQIRLSV